MARSPYNRHPLPPLFAGALALLAAVLVALFVLNAIAYAYRRIGISEGALFGLVWLSLVGGFINIPVARLRGQAQRGVREIASIGGAGTFDGVFLSGIVAVLLVGVT